MCDGGERKGSPGLLEGSSCERAGTRVRRPVLGGVGTAVCQQGRVDGSARRWVARKDA